MKNILGLFVVLFATSSITFAQEKNEKENNEHINVPAKVKEALKQKYPEAKNVGWEKENGNYEANWGGKSGEDHSVQFTPSGDFIEIVNSIPVSQLPKSVFTYVKDHYKTSHITEAGKVTDAKGKQYFEAEVKGRDVIFDEQGNFVKAE